MAPAQHPGPKVLYVMPRPAGEVLPRHAPGTFGGRAGIGHPGLPGPVLLSVVLLALALAIAALIVTWRRASGHRQAEGRRGRLRDCAWCTALVAFAALVTVNAYRALAAGSYRWWLAAIPLAAALIVLLAPRLAARLVPAALVVFGVTGFGLARVRTADHLLSGYGVARVGDPSMTGLIVAQAWVFLLAGGWLGWRELTRHPAAARRVLGRLADGSRPGPRWAVLLLPVSVAIAERVGSDAWFGLLLLLAVASAVLMRWLPVLASRVATACVLLLGVAGLLLFHHWDVVGWDQVSVAVQPGGSSSPVIWPSPDRLFGFVDATSTAMGSLVAAQAAALIGLGCWLVPQTFPQVRTLLGLAPDAELTQQVQRLTASRAVAVDTAAADLRRLERDLHDGAQARLVALGMNLRAAERLVHTSPEAAAALIVEAREASARALTELRELVRGVHPPVLADRGLADAVRALALDCPLRVETDVQLPGRPPAPVETACYFAVAELLTNAAKHSGARSARITLSHAGGVLRIEVTDFGLGGADPAAGSGLTGVEKRLATFDGILAVSSPPGGPTIVVLEVPCALSSPKTSSC